MNKVHLANNARLSRANDNLHLIRGPFVDHDLLVLPDTVLSIARSHDRSNGAEKKPLADVRGVIPKHKKRLFIWKVSKSAGKNYASLGQRLAQTGNLYRDEAAGHGLLLVRPDGTTRCIRTGNQLRPLIVDRVPMQVKKNGTVFRELPPAEHLNAMLYTRAFLDQFQPLDEVTKEFCYVNGFEPVRSGYSDHGPGNRIFFHGNPPKVTQSLDAINRFLDAMPFASDADRANTIAAGLTVRLRRMWAGEKPMVTITCTQSHGGKTTTSDFIRGSVTKADILYESNDWPMQCQFQKQIRANPDIGVIVFDNVRLDSAGGRAKVIRSSFLESFVTNPEVILASPTAGEPMRFRNKYVIILNMNDGALSPDLLNRSLPIHLAPKGDIQNRKSKIGNPRLEYLPQNQERIEAEFQGAIQRWLEAGSPLDESVMYPMTPWARTIGGILKVNGITGFLENYGMRKSADDPLREALSILGAARPNEALRPMEWAEEAVKLGLARTLFSINERDTEKGRERAIGVIISNRKECEFEGASEDKLYRLRLEGGFLRWTKGANPHVRYRFTVLSETKRPVEGELGS
jgi:hypothetical protein